MQGVKLAVEFGAHEGNAFGVAGVLLGLDFGGEEAFLGFDELGLGVDFGAGLLGAPAFLLEAEEGFGVVAAAEAVELEGDGEEGFALGGVVGGLGGSLLQAVAEGDGEGGGEVGGDGGVVRVCAQAGGLFAEVVDPGAGLLGAEPVGEAALAPFGEVLGGDGAGGELGGEDG
jgi:hypothetical protein